MARCLHDWDPSDRCPWCYKERTYQQFGNPLIGQVGLEKQGPARSQINNDEEPCSPCDELEEEEIMAEYVRNSFTTKLEDTPRNEGDFSNLDY